MLLFSHVMNYLNIYHIIIMSNTFLYKNFVCEFNFKKSPLCVSEKIYTIYVFLNNKYLDNVFITASSNEQMFKYLSNYLDKIYYVHQPDISPDF